MLSVTFLIFTVCSFSDAVLIVNTNKSITFRCNNNLDIIDNLRWTFVPHLKNEEIVVYDHLQSSVNTHFTALCTQQSCNLTLLRATEENVGMYKCKASDKPGNFKTILELILTVGNLECHSSLSSVLLSENDCTNHSTSILERTCLVKMHGNITKSPVLSWSRGYKNNSILEENPPFEYITTLNGKKSYGFQQPLIVTADMDGMILKCKMKDHDGVEPCLLPPLNVHYAKKIPKNSELLDMENLHDVTCSVNKSDKIDCDYEWFYQMEKAKTIIPGPRLEIKYLKNSGFYNCHATCTIGAKKCTINAMNVEVKDFSTDKRIYKNSSLISAVVVVIVLAVVITAIVLVYKRFSLLKTKTPPSNHSNANSTPDQTTQYSPISQA